MLDKLYSRQNRRITVVYKKQVIQNKQNIFYKFKEPLITYVNKHNPLINTHTVAAGIHEKSNQGQIYLVGEANNPSPEPSVTINASAMIR